MSAAPNGAPRNPSLSRKPKAKRFTKTPKYLNNVYTNVLEHFTLPALKWEPVMVEVSSAEVGRNFRHYREKAESEPVVILHYNKPSVVILAASEFERLKRRDKKVMSIEEMPDWLAALVVNGSMDPRHGHLDEVKAPEGFADSAPTEP